MRPVRESNAHFVSSSEQTVRLRQSRRYWKRCSITLRDKGAFLCLPEVAGRRCQTPRADAVASRQNRGRVYVWSPTGVACGRGKSTRGPSRCLRAMINQITRSLIPDFCFWIPPFLTSLCLVYKRHGLPRNAPQSTRRISHPRLMRPPPGGDPCHPLAHRRPAATRPLTLEGPPEFQEPRFAR